MKKIYVSPECELILINKEDVISTSNDWVTAPDNETKLPEVGGGWC